MHKYLHSHHWIWSIEKRLEKIEVNKCIYNIFIPLWQHQVRAIMYLKASILQIIILLNLDIISNRLQGSTFKLQLKPTIR